VLGTSGGILTPSINVVHRSRTEVGTANGSIYSGPITRTINGVSTTFPTNPFSGELLAGSAVPPFWLVNASLSLRTDDGNWLVAVECDNCFDKAYVQSSLVNYNYISPPRTWMVRAKRNF
jgi:iron complex outermembrane receptor protein